MNYAAGVEKVKTLSDITQLVAGISVGSNATIRVLARSTRSAPGFLLIYSVKSPPDIHSEMSWSGVKVMPMSGTMFWCAKCFHTTASLQNVCNSLQERRVGK